HAAAKPENRPHRIVKAARSTGFRGRRARVAVLDARNNDAPTNPRIARPTIGVEIAPARPMAHAPPPAANRSGRAPALRHARAVCSAANAATAEYSMPIANRPAIKASRVRANQAQPRVTRGPFTS